MITDINLTEASKKTGKSELEIAKAIIMLLAVKAEKYGIPQKITLKHHSIKNEGNKNGTPI